MVRPREPFWCVRYEITLQRKPGIYRLKDERPWKERESRNVDDLPNLDKFKGFRIEERG
jgi:hypothetical protein